MWILEEILEAVYTSYETLPGGREPLPRDDDRRIPLGSIQKARNKGFRVIWILQTGNFGDPKLAAAGPPTDPAQPVQGNSPHYSALARFWVWIWEKDQEAAWNVMVDLLAALRATVYGPNLRPQNFTYPTELDGKNIELGSLCIVDLEIAVPLPRDGTVAAEELAIATAETNVKLRNDLSGLETDPPPAADIELVIVENDGT
jgi:hypothetical protein